ncbi:MAG TPA: proton-conducting transporter membrane subunit [Actinomycetes bacterium]
MGAVLWLPLAAAVLAATVSLRIPRVARLAGIAVSVVVLGTGLVLGAAALDHRVVTAAGGLLRADALSAFMLVVIGAVGLTATWGGLQARSAPGPAALMSAFLGAMSLAVLADNLGVLWVAVEGTTIATAFLVGQHRTRASLEAAWKYVVLGSVGVAIAFLGIVLVYAATRASGTPTLSWVDLVRHPTLLDPAVLKLGAALAVLGFATKAGLAPMHSWLPDAHSQAPAPVSGLMSGVLLSVAFYAILRIQAVANPVLGPGLLRGMLAVAGLLSLAVAAALLLRQRDYKRMLAYSSVEHMGLLALGAAAGGPLALTAVLLHMLGHGLAKSSLFVVSGRLLAVEHSTAVADIRGLLARRPGLAVPWLAGTAALLGLPPFSLFFSEVGIVVGAWTAGLQVVTAVGLGLLLVAFAALVRLTATMTLGAGGPGEEPDRSAHGPWLPLALALAVVAVIALLSGPFGTLLRQAAAVLGGAS